MYHTMSKDLQCKLFTIALLQLARPHNISCFTIALLQLMQAPKSLSQRALGRWMDYLTIQLDYTYTLRRILTNVKLGLRKYISICIYSTQIHSLLFFLIRIELVGSHSGSEGTVSHCRLCPNKYQMLGL